MLLYVLFIIKVSYFQFNSPAQTQVGHKVASEVDLQYRVKCKSFPSGSVLVVVKLHLKKYIISVL